MKLIIDIPDELAKKEHWYTDEEMWTVIKAAQNGIPIPDNATVCDIEQIRAEIADNHDYYFFAESNKDIALGLEFALDIIDKYK